eukprot:m.21814 g.21814  ORF g.21814 m.21814 type:complete len:186 (+) comp8152_c0_seq1:281-838(+)
MSEPAEYDTLIKVLLIGDERAGKTSLLLRYCDDTYQERYLPTIGIDYRVRHEEYDGKDLKMLIWDTAGAERFRTITRAYYRGAHAILFMYDATSATSFALVSDRIAQAAIHGEGEYVGLLVATKCDLMEKRTVSYQQGMEFAAQHNLRFVETSAKDNINVNNLFHVAAVDAADMLTKRRLAQRGT